MVENRPFVTIMSHLVLLLGVLIVAFPLWMTFVASTHDQATMLRAPVPLLPGNHMVDNYRQVLFEGFGRGFGGAPIWVTLMNSMIMALGVAFGKIAISILSAFAIVYFRFPLRKTFFWAIFVTLMLPVEVRIVPTYGVVATLGMLDTYPGLIVPLIASATATFLFRQFFLSVPDELAEAARVDGASPMRFFWDILLPMSRTTIAALFVIQFIYGWNQYLWPLLITTKEGFYTVVMAVSRQANAVDATPSWNLLMAMALLAMLPPVLVVVFMQRQFVREPAVFLFDEPLSNLDAKLRVQMRSEIKELHQRLKVTTVYVTHDQIEAMTMADKIVVMNGGNIEQIGAPLELYDRPANVFVAGFIGSPAMNILKGNVVGGHLRTDDGTDWPLPTHIKSAKEGPAIYGVRPEHLRLAADGIPATVQLVEPTGSETQVMMKIGNQTMVGAFRERVTARPGEILPVLPDPALVHLFDQQTGQRL